MSAIWCSGKLGTAYYDMGLAQISMQMDILETRDFQFLKRCKKYFLKNNNQTLFNDYVDVKSHIKN